MKKSRFTDSQIMAIIKQAESGTPVPELCREHGMSAATFYKWRALNAVPEPERAETSLELNEAPLANTSRYDSLRDAANGTLAVDQAWCDRRSAGATLTRDGERMDDLLCWRKRKRGLVVPVAD